MTKRWAKRLEAPDLWEVYDCETGLVVYLHGFPLNGLDEHEADEYVQLLEDGEIVPGAEIDRAT